MRWWWAIGLLLVGGQVHAALPSYVFAPIASPEAPSEHHPEIEARYTTAFRVCHADPKATTYSLNMCLIAEMKVQDEAINQQWPNALARVGKGRVPALRAAERQWIAKRQSYCSGWSDEYRGGTIAPLIYGNCYIDETIRRTIWLERLR